MKDMTNESVKVEVKLSKEFVSDILVTAFDQNWGGCNYWAGVDSLHLEEGSDEKPHSDRFWEKLEIEDQILTPEESETRHWCVDAGTIAEGIKNWIDAYPGYQSTADIVQAVIKQDGGMIDADLADSIIQMGLWDELRYG